MSKILTVEQTAEKLQMTPKVVREHLRKGRLPGRKVGKTWRVLESNLELWVSAGHQPSSAGFVSARGLLRKYPGSLSSREVIADKRREAEIEDAKCGKPDLPRRKSA